MTVRASAVNPSILRWARERAGLSITQVAEALGRSAESIAAWESGEQAPTYRQLEILARGLYKRPLAVFFFPQPPAEKEITTEFRTLPESESARLETDTLFALREARAWQLALPELTTGLEGPSELITDVIKPGPEYQTERLAEDVRSFLKVPLQRQQSWQGAEQALKEWRAAVEAVGVFVFKRSFQQREISGFCLHDERHPLIVINNGTAHTRQIFTLFHELGHLLFGVSGITTRHQAYLSSLPGDARAVEVACNRFAAEYLVPSKAFPWALFRDVDLDTAVEITATQFNVSREVILRRLLDSRVIDSGTYEEKVDEWAEDYFRNGGGGGGSYYANQGTYFSPAFLNAAFYQYHSGNLSLGDLADRLGMKAQNVGRFEEFLLKRR
jgi:Zn-dependent peptidase ImmA (M78 family)